MAREQPANRHISEARVVVTGMGACTPIGIGTQAFWRNALAGVSGLKEVRSFDHRQLRTHVGGEIHDFDPKDHLGEKEAAKLGRASQLAVAAARMALEDAGLDGAQLERYTPHRRAVSFGTTMGEPGLLDSLVADIVARGYQQVDDDKLFALPSFRLSNHLARLCRFHGCNYQIPTACTAGNSAIGYGADLLRSRRADVVLAGGADAFSRMAHVGFNKLLAVTPDCVRPFDLNRSGMAVAEGSGALVLERLEDAQARGATVLAEFLDYGLGCDAHKMTIPDPGGRGGSIALEQALARAQVAPQEVGYVSAHGTGTRENDKIETQIIKRTFGEHASNLKISSLKSMLGHTMGAASAIEAIACVHVLTDQRIPPTINYETPDPECDLDYVPNTGQSASLEVVASNAYAFGGNCSTILMRRYQGS